MDRHPEILGNAKRLLEDAELLAESERWGSVLALSVFSIEECGKFIQSNRSTYRSRLEKRNRDHRQKHQASVTYSLAKALNDAMEVIGLTFRHEDDLTDNQKKWDQSEQGRALAESVRDGIGEFKVPSWAVDKMVEILSSGKHKRALSHSKEFVSPGYIEMTKHGALYVDFAEDGEIRNSPEDITSQEATRFLEFAHDLVVALEQDHQLRSFHS